MVIGVPSLRRREYSRSGWKDSPTQSFTIAASLHSYINIITPYPYYYPIQLALRSGLKNDEYT